jgi:hypothetical protein
MVCFPPLYSKWLEVFLMIYVTTSQILIIIEKHLYILWLYEFTSYMSHWVFFLTIPRSLNLNMFSSLKPQSNNVQIKVVEGDSNAEVRPQS